MCFFPYSYIILAIVFFLPSCSKPEKADIPILTTNPVSEIYVNSALSGGNITYDGGALITERGVCWSPNPNPNITDNRSIDGGGEGNFVSSLINLIEGTKYYVAAYATNSSGTGYGAVITFSTLGELPSSKPVTATNILSSSVTLNGLVISNYLSTVAIFEYGTSVIYGETVTALQSPISAIEETVINANISGLSPNTVYHFRVKTTNSLGTSFSDDLSFKTLDALTDIEGNVYNVLTIGTQVWMTENLRTSHFRDGTLIPYVINENTWYNGTSSMFCWYNNDSETYKKLFGGLYNWYSVNTGKLCPNGWHIPSDAEWTVLSEYLGGELIAGSKMKEIGTEHWMSPNSGATNESGFSGLPGGYQYGKSRDLGISCSWWSSTIDETLYNGQQIYAKNRSLLYNQERLFREFQLQNFGYGIRCVKD